MAGSLIYENRRLLQLRSPELSCGALAAPQVGDVNTHEAKRPARPASCARADPISSFSENVTPRHPLGRFRARRCVRMLSHCPYSTAVLVRLTRCFAAQVGAIAVTALGFGFFGSEFVGSHSLVSLPAAMWGGVLPIRKNEPHFSNPRVVTATKDVRIGPSWRGRYDDFDLMRRGLFSGWQRLLVRPTDRDGSIRHSGRGASDDGGPAREGRQAARPTPGRSAWTYWSGLHPTPNGSCGRASSNGGVCAGLCLTPTFSTRSNDSAPPSWGCSRRGAFKD